MEKHQANFETVWADKPFYACQRHMGGIYNIAAAMGVPMPQAKPYFGEELCQNCVNEAKKTEE